MPTNVTQIFRLNLQSFFAPNGPIKIKKKTSKDYKKAQVK